MKSQNWQTARVVKSVPERGWGLAEQTVPARGPVKEFVVTLFLHVSRNIIQVLCGSEIISRPARDTATIPAVGEVIAFRDVVSPEGNGHHFQAAEWFLEAERVKMQVAAQKAAATLAEKAAEVAVRDHARREAMARDARKHGSGSKNQQSKKGKKREKAVA